LILVAAVMIAALWSSGDALREPALEQLKSASAELAQANQRLVQVAIVNKDSVKDATSAAAVDLKLALQTHSDVVRSFSAASAALIDGLKKSDQQPSEVVPFANIVTGSLALALLTFLGMTRLGQIDGELKALRSSLMTEVNERSQLAEGALTAKLTSAIEDRVASSARVVGRTVDEAIARLSESEGRAQSTAEAAIQKQHQVLGEYEALRAKIEELPRKFPFLESAESLNLVQSIERVRSVEAAQELASKLSAQDEQESARVALMQIIDRDLPGDADSFHNAHSEAMRLMDPALGLRLATAGLKAFPGNADLAADVVIAKVNSKDASDAIRFGQQWIHDHRDVVRTWRFGVFMAVAYKTVGINEVSRAELLEFLRAELAAYPREEKLWSELARIVRQQDSHAAYLALDDADRRCPNNQELRFVRAQFLLADGRFTEARELLEQAIGCDIQDQFQNNVNQAAIVVYYGQCLEGLGQYESARSAYRASFKVPGFHRMMEKFVVTRLALLAIVTGDNGGAGEPPSGVMDMLAQLQAAMDRPSGERGAG
jgi:tetratricopeptide (TPR) repeat protein